MKTRYSYKYFLLSLLVAVAWFSLSAFSLQQPASQGTNPGDPYFYYTISYDAYGNPCYYFPNAKAVHCGALNSYVFAQLYPPKAAFQYPSYQPAPYQPVPYYNQYPTYPQTPYYNQYPYQNQYYPYNPYAYNYYGAYSPYSSYYNYNYRKYNSNAQAACHAAWVGKDGAIIASERMGRNWRIQYCDY